MNDPNGLVYFNGTYELYYQYNPLQLVAGNQSWGHATSSDLIHWVNANPQIAIPQILSGPLQGQIFTGSAVVDSNNTSGFFTGHPGQALVAIYTLNQPTREVQNVAYSLDNGLTYNSLHEKTLFTGPAQVSDGSSLFISLHRNSSFEFDTTIVAQPISGQQQQRLYIDISNDAGETVSVGYDWSQGQVFVDRGRTTGFFDPFFTDKFAAWDANANNSIELHVFVDRSTLEVFVNGGIEVCTTTFFMQHGPPRKCS